MKKCIAVDMVNYVLLIVSLVVFHWNDWLTMITYILAITYLTYVNYKTYMKDMLGTTESRQEYHLGLYGKIAVTYFTVFLIWLEGGIDNIVLCFLVVVLTIDICVVRRIYKEFIYGYEKQDKN